MMKGMDATEIIAKVKSLHLPRDSYVLYGSCPMALHGIREANDIDLLVTSKVLNRLEKSGWKKIIKGPKDHPFTFEEFEAHDNWNFSNYCPSLEQLQSSATIVEGIPFASIQEVRKWKAASTRSKFKRDVELIDEYLSREGKS